MTEQKEFGAWYWHIHHGVLAERADEPIAGRIKYIKEEKPKDEVALRLRLLKRVKNQKALNDALEAYNKAYATAWGARDEAYAAAREAYDEAVAAAREARDEAVAAAREAYDKAYAAAWEARDEAGDDLHAKECPNCPWDGQTIFPEKEEE